MKLSLSFAIHIASCKLSAWPSLSASKGAKCRIALSHLGTVRGAAGRATSFALNVLNLAILSRSRLAVGVGLDRAGSRALLGGVAASALSGAVAGRARGRRRRRTSRSVATLDNDAVAGAVGGTPG